MQGKKLAAFCALILITLSQVAAISLEGKKFLGTNCKAGKFDLPEGSSETLVFEKGNIVKLVGTGHGFSSSGRYEIQEAKKIVIMRFNENGQGTLIGTYTDSDCASMAVDGDVSRGILHITLSGNFIRQ